jgi:hypothetical protein
MRFPKLALHSVCRRGMAMSRNLRVVPALQLTALRVVWPAKRLHSVTRSDGVDTKRNIEVRMNMML